MKAPYAMGLTWDRSEGGSPQPHHFISCLSSREVCVGGALRGKKMSSRSEKARLLFCSPLTLL